MKELWPRNESWLICLLLAAAVLCQRAAGQCYIDAYGNQVCPQQQPGYGWQPQQENIVQESGWPDDRIVRLEDGGTAAFITHNGRPMLLSCAHEVQGTVDPGQRIGFRTNDGSRHIATVMQVDPGSDCSLLTFNGTLHAKPFPIAESPLQPGDRVYVAGFPMGRYRVRLATVQRDGSELALTGSATPGESGGPIITERGEVAGVLFGDERHPQTGQSIGRTLCCGRQPIRRMLDAMFPNRSGRIIPRATVARRNGSVGGQYRPPLDPVQPIPQGPGEIDPRPQDPEPEIDWEAWEEQQEEIRAKQDQQQQQLQSLVVKVESIDPLAYMEPVLALEGRLSTLEQAQKQLIENDNRILNIVENQQSQPGPPGPQGIQGPPGPSEPFFIRVRNPKTGEVSPYATVNPGQYVTLDLVPAQ